LAASQNPGYVLYSALAAAVRAAGMRARSAEVPAARAGSALADTRQRPEKLPADNLLGGTAYGRAWRREVTVMAASAQEGGWVPDPDLYQLLGVDRLASGGEITRAWRRRAAAEHPDRRPRDATAPARFRALTEAYEVLGNPARRAAYDRSRGGQPSPGTAAPEGPAAAAPSRRPQGSGVQVAVRRAGRAPEPPLRAGPVWLEVPVMVPAAGPRTAQDDVVWLAALAELAVRCLAGDRGWPW
jgi:hypothetical protein